MKKRITCLVLTLLMCLSLIACSSETSEYPDTSADTTSASLGTQTQIHSTQPENPKAPVNLIVGTIGQPETTSIFSQSGSLGKFNYNSITYANFFSPMKTTTCIHIF